MSKKKYTPKKNPRFVWNIGAISEQYPDMANINQASTVLWDRQEEGVVVQISGHYSNAFCLETTRFLADAPFTNLERWFNHMSNKALASEGIPPTK